MIYLLRISGQLLFLVCFVISSAGPSIEPRIVSFSIRFLLCLGPLSSCFCFFRFFSTKCSTFIHPSVFLVPDFCSFLALCSFLVGRLSVFWIVVGKFWYLTTTFVFAYDEAVKSLPLVSQGRESYPDQASKNSVPDVFCIFLDFLESTNLECLKMFLVLFLWSISSIVYKFVEFKANELFLQKFQVCPKIPL